MITEKNGENTEYDSAIIGLAEEVLDIARNRLIVNLRYMDMALSFHGKTEYFGTISTDGRNLSFDPIHVLKTYRESAEQLTRTYLHSVLHCIFQHPFVSSAVNRRMWDLACDIACEATISELGLSCTVIDAEVRQRDELRKIRQVSGALTAEKIYHDLRQGKFTISEIDEWSTLFRGDEHSLWYPEDALNAYDYDHGTDSEIKEDGRTTSGLEEDRSVLLITADDAHTAESWQRIAEQIEMDIEMFSRVRGRYASALIQNLRAVTREKYNYSEFLRKFACIREILKVSEDEFDQIYYTYGLTNYGNMPLIEPLEYREDRKIHDFVIAIDTSGSVAGEEVQQFLQKTFSILKSRESFDRQINVYIIQCDAEIQSIIVITSERDLDAYIGKMEIRGLGGTDFRPVFRYVDELISKGDMKDLRGLLYFTDGLGTFPEHMPAYKTAFVFLENGYNIPEVPPWAMRVVLGSREFEDFA